MPLGDRPVKPPTYSQAESVTDPIESPNPIDQAFDSQPARAMTDKASEPP